MRAKKERDKIQAGGGKGGHGGVQMGRRQMESYIHQRKTADEGGQRSKGRSNMEDQVVSEEASNHAEGE